MRFLFGLVLLSIYSLAVDPVPMINLSVSALEEPVQFVKTINIVIILALLVLAPSLLLMVTSFTRIIIVMHFVRSALGTQTTPPNQVLVGLALFLTLFIMSPVFTEINESAIQPLAANEISQEEAFLVGMAPLRTFMLEQTEVKDLRLLDRKSVV